MSDIETTEQNPNEESSSPHVCGRDYKLHVQRAFVGLMMMGLGGNCFDTYRALVEVAEYMRQENSLPKHIPSEAGSMEVRIIIDEMEAAQRKMQEEMQLAALASMDEDKLPKT